MRERLFATLVLIVPAICYSLLDAGLTLYGQSDSYWSGNYADVNELSPSARGYLGSHPFAFLFHIACWISIFTCLILLLPEIPATFVSVTVIIVHMTGAASWLAFRLASYQACGWLFLITAAVLVATTRFGRYPQGQTLINWGRFGWLLWVRWLAVVLLFAFPIYWSLIPH
jgi:hypothetical protein